MSANHETLDALRRVAKDRAATPAEKATARRLAKALAGTIGKRPRKGRRKTESAALPEPPAATWRRRWIARLETALHKVVVAGAWLHAIWIASLVGMGLVLTLGSDTLRKQANDVYFIRTLWLLAAALTIVTVVGALTLTKWWLKTWRQERLRPALAFVSELVASVTLMAACVGVGEYLEKHLKWPLLLAFVVSLVVAVALSIPYWRWAVPAIRRALLRSSDQAGGGRWPGA
jgi:hypothetical protein